MKYLDTFDHVDRDEVSQIFIITESLLAIYGNMQMGKQRVITTRNVAHQEVLLKVSR